MNRTGLILAFVTGIVLSSQPSNAQYTSDFQTNIISGVTSNWLGTYNVGYSNFADVLLIQNAGVLSNGTAFLGYGAGSTNNSVVVIDPGSVWSNRFDLYFGRSGAGNSLVISNGGHVVSGPGGQGIDSVGQLAGSSNNHVVVTGAGSAWLENQFWFVFGDEGSSNTLVINNGGLVAVTGSSFVGLNESSRNNNVLITGTVSTWNNNGTLTIGYWGNGNSMVLSNGGQVASAAGGIGGSAGGAGSWSNSVLVTGIGSVWSNSGTLSVGPSKEGENSLIINDGGKVLNGYGLLISASNRVFVSGAGSVWSNRNDLWVGGYGGGNYLVISNGGQVIVTGSSTIGGSTGSGNRACIVDSGWWQNSAVTVGNLGSSNSLLVAGGSVIATNLIIGAASPNCDNLLQLDNGNVIVTNVASDATLEVRYGKLILNGGLLQTDKLIITNACARLIRNGGTLSVGTLVLDPNASAVGDGIPNGWKQQYHLDPFDPAVANADPDGDGMSNLQEFLAGTDPTNNASAFRIIDIEPEGNSVRVTWKGGGSRANVIQAASDVGGTYSDISPNIVLLGTGDVTTNYLDVGGATNGPVRLYRVRQCPECVYTISTSSAPLGGGTTSGGGTVAGGSNVMVCAVATSFYSFVKWTDQNSNVVSTSACYTFTAVSDATLVANFALTDSVGDGIPDFWRAQYFGGSGMTTDSLSCAACDGDGDGFTSLQEYLAGTDPTNNASAFRIIGITSQADGFRVTWRMGNGKTNALQAAAPNNSYDTNLFTDLFIVTNTVGSVTNYLDIGAATNATSRFYRVRLVP